jgi:hypothetical protein
MIVPIGIPKSKIARSTIEPVHSRQQMGEGHYHYLIPSSPIHAFIWEQTPSEAALQHIS